MPSILNLYQHINVSYWEYFVQVIQDLWNLVLWKPQHELLNCLRYVFTFPLAVAPTSCMTVDLWYFIKFSSTTFNCCCDTSLSVDVGRVSLYVVKGSLVMLSECSMPHLHWVPQLSQQRWGCSGYMDTDSKWLKRVFLLHSLVLMKDFIWISTWFSITTLCNPYATLCAHPCLPYQSLEHKTLHFWRVQNVSFLDGKDSKMFCLLAFLESSPVNIDFPKRVLIVA